MDSWSRAIPGLFGASKGADGNCWLVEEKSQRRLPGEILVDNLPSPGMCTS